jgi:hypothetical protein
MKYYKLDKDVKQYLKRINIDGFKAPADIYTLNDFVVGLKDINLFNFVEMYFYSTIHNSSSGTKIYAFRDIRNDGTISGTHTRRLDGFQFPENDPNTFINSNLLLPFAPCNLVWITNLFLGATCNSSGLLSRGVNFNGNQFSIGGSCDSRLFVDSLGGNWANSITSAASPGGKLDNNFHFFSLNMSGNKGPIIFNTDGSITTGSTSGGSVGFNDIQTIYAPRAYFSRAVILHSALIYDRSLTNIENALLYSLIKSTIGKTLKIP